jgi:hypothetical protein
MVAQRGTVTEMTELRGVFMRGRVGRGIVYRCETKVWWYERMTATPVHYASLWVCAMPDRMLTGLVGALRA